MRKTIISFLATILSVGIAASQTTVKIEDFGSIYCPASMEIQGGDYKEYVDKMKEINGISASKVILQQKGLNDGGSFNTYARVMIRTTYGEFNSIYSPVSQSDANDVNNIFERQIKGEAYSNNAVILSWDRAIPTTLNGYKAIRFGYSRKVGSNPIVTVQTYLIQNRDKMYSISFEHRTDSYNWASVFLQIKNSIKIY